MTSGTSLTNASPKYVPNLTLLKNDSRVPATISRPPASLRRLVTSKAVPTLAVNSDVALSVATSDPINESQLSQESQPRQEGSVIADKRRSKVGNWLSSSLFLIKL